MLLSTYLPIYSFFRFVSLIGYCKILTIVLCVYNRCMLVISTMYVHAKWLQSCSTLCNPVGCRSLTPLSMGFSRPEYWRVLPCPPPGYIMYSSVYMLILLICSPSIFLTINLFSMFVGLFLFLNKFICTFFFFFPDSTYQFSSVQLSCLVMSDSLQPHELQHARPPCPSPTPGVHSNSCPLSQ